MGVIFGVQAQPKGKERRVAVIFANQNYQISQYSLSKTHNDAEDMKASLERLGFRVITFEKDLSRLALNREIRALKTKLQGYDVAFFYYSGHGSAFRDENFLIPTDIATIEDNSDVENQGVSLNKVYVALNESGIKTSIVVLDACRNLVYGKGGPTDVMKIPANNPAGTFTMFATRLGKVAKENLRGRNSFFTQELLKHIETPNLTLNQIYYETRRGVKEATSGTQEPGVSNELDADFVFITDGSPYVPTVIAKLESPVSPTNQMIAVVALKGGVLDDFELAQEAADILKQKYPNYSFVPFEKKKLPQSTVTCLVDEMTENDSENRYDNQIHKFKTRVVLTVRNADGLFSSETITGGATDYSKENARRLSVTRTLELTEKLKFEKR